MESVFSDNNQERKCNKVFGSSGPTVNCLSGESVINDTNQVRKCTNIENTLPTIVHNFKESNENNYDEINGKIC